ncbi:MAG: DUF3576 domain-containing protein [Pseudomonadota bacterium]|nr:DUF3576 domain-containing protein [Pseudomonadota bacterium]
MKINKLNLKFLLVMFFSLSIMSLTGCGMYDEYVGGGSNTNKEDNTQADYHDETPIDEIDYTKRDTLFGKGGLDNIFGGGSKQPGGGELGVNSFLWRASLDTIAFMPVSSADPFGGVIITDWYSPSEAPNERFKLNVYILDKTLRADGIRVSAFRQVQDRLGNWKDSGIPDKTGTKIEDAILIRARQLRNQSKNE